MIGTPLDWLRLTRSSNLPTVATNILAATAVVGEAFTSRWWLLFVAVTAVYAAGMILNDLTDRATDRLERPDRPIPSGRIALFPARLVAVTLIGLAMALTGLHAMAALPWMLLLILLVGLYNALPRHSFVSTRLMSSCRAMIPVITCFWLGVDLSLSLQILVVSCFVYTELISQLAKAEATIEGRAGVVQYVIAGFCLHDAMWTLGEGRSELALIAVVCFFLTLALHRVIPGS
ncbi:MAG: UbiA family prenyltransferase [Phycisphaeraceae bacterium]